MIYNMFIYNYLFKSILVRSLSVTYLTSSKELTIKSGSAVANTSAQRVVANPITFDHAAFAATIPLVASSIIKHSTGSSQINFAAPKNNAGFGFPIFHT